MYNDTGIPIAMVVHSMGGPMSPQIVYIRTYVQRNVNSCEPRNHVITCAQKHRLIFYRARFQSRVHARAGTRSRRRAKITLPYINI